MSLTLTDTLTQEDYDLVKVFGDKDSIRIGSADDNEIVIKKSPRGDTSSPNVTQIEDAPYINITQLLITVGDNHAWIYRSPDTGDFSLSDVKSKYGISFMEHGVKVPIKTWTPVTLKDGDEFYLGLYGPFECSTS